MSIDTHDAETAEALREAGLPVSAEMSTAEAYRAYMIPAQAAMRKQAKANEVALKGLFVDWAFNSLNLNKYR